MNSLTQQRLTGCNELDVVLGQGEAMVRDFGMNMNTLLCLKWVNNKVRPSVQHTEPCSMSGGSLDGREFAGEWTHL